MKFLPLLLFVALLLGCSSSQTEEKKRVPQEKFQVADRFSGGLGMTSEGEDVYIWNENEIFLWQENESKSWLDVSARSSQIWSVAFSGNWDLDRLFYVYYQNKGEASVLGEGLQTATAAELRRPVLRRPPSEGGGLAADGNNLLLFDKNNLLRIRPTLGDGVAYTVPANNPRGEEMWASLPQGRWQIAPLGDEWIIWGESIRGDSYLWQMSLADLRGSVLQLRKASWNSPCALVAGYEDDGGYIFADQCTGELLLWNGKEMKKQKEVLEGVIALTKTESATWALLQNGDLLRRKK